MTTEAKYLELVKARLDVYESIKRLKEVCDSMGLHFDSDVEDIVFELQESEVKKNERKSNINARKIKRIKKN